MDTERRGKLRWKDILALAGIGALVPLMLLGYNLGREAYESRRQTHLQARYGDGLWPCMMGDSAEAYRQKIGMPSDLLMVVLAPPDQPSELIAISGSNVRAQEFELFPRGTFRAPPGGPRQVTLAPDLTSAIVETITEDIHNVRAEPNRGMDGLYYLFFTASGQCGETWTPRKDTRARKLVEATHALLQTADSPEGSRQEQAVARLRDALESLQD